MDGRCSCVANGCTDGLFCNTGSQKCVGCLEDAHCTDPSKPWCDSGKGQCVACTGVDGTCRKEMTVGTVACSTYGTCEPMCAEDVRFVFYFCMDDYVAERRLTQSPAPSSTRQADCLLESRPYCDLSSSRCAACREDSDCGPSAPFCLAAEEVTMDGTTRLTPARCVQCRSPSSTEDCHLGLTCNSQNFCAMCSSNNECPKDRPICSTDTRSCVQCDERAGLSCPKERPICHSGRCLGCESDADCGNVLLCDPNTNRCELCLTHQVRDSLHAHTCRSVTHPISLDPRIARPSTASLDRIVHKHISVTNVGAIRTVLTRCVVKATEKQEAAAGGWEVVALGLVLTFHRRPNTLTRSARSIISFPIAIRYRERAFSARPFSPAKRAVSAMKVDALTVQIPANAPRPCRFATYNLVVALNAKTLETVLLAWAASKGCARNATLRPQPSAPQ